MNIIFSDLFKKESEANIGVSIDQAKQVITSPDVQDIKKLDDFVLGFFVKRFDSQSLLLLCAHQHDNNWIVDLAFQLPTDLMGNTSSLEPLVLLQAFAHRFGLQIRVGQQFNKFIFQENLPIKNTQNSLTNLVEIINPLNHPYVQNIHLKIEQRDDHKSANVALAYCIDMTLYLAWLRGEEIEEVPKEVEVLISPQLRGHITARDLIKPTGTLTFVTDYAQVTGRNSGLMFKLLSKEYNLEVGFTKTAFYIMHNDQKLELNIDSTSKLPGNIYCCATWSPTKLILRILDRTFGDAVDKLETSEEGEEEVRKRTEILNTSPIVPPNSLLTWARREAIAPVTAYRSNDRFYEVVISSLQSITDKVEALGLHNPFWNITYDGAKIVSRIPKHETDIHPTIHGLLFDIGIAKNFLITPEYQVAGGRLDFLISGTLAKGEMVNACVEFKHAHSDSVEDDLVKQLPAYMHAKGTDLGVYCVMYFRGKHFPEPHIHDKHSLEMSLELAKAAAGLDNIRVILMDFTHKTSPSKL